MGTAFVDGHRARVLLDDGSQINSITPAYAKSLDLVIGPLEELAGNPTGRPIQGIGGVRTGTIGYVVFHAQIEGIPSYDEEQVALVVDDSSYFARKVPVILGTPTLHRVVKYMKESEMESAPPEWNNVRLGYEIHNRLYSHRANYKPDSPFPTNTNEDPTDLDELVRLTNPVILPAFGSCIVKGRTTKTMMTGIKLNVMTQAPYAEDEANLPVGLYVMRNRVEMNPGSWTVHLVLRNGTSRPIKMSAGRKVGRVVAVNIVPKAKVSPELLRQLGMEDRAKEPKMTIPERQVELIKILEKDGGLDMLKDWPEDDARRARRLLMGYHDVFSLDKNEMGCTDATEHVIKLTKSEPFKERFRRIAPPLVEGDPGTLRFCIDFQRLNNQTEKDSFPMPKMVDMMETMVGARIFSTMNLKSGFWQVKMAEESRPYTAFMVGSLGVYKFL